MKKTQMKKAKKTVRKKSKPKAAKKRKKKEETSEIIFDSQSGKTDALFVDNPPEAEISFLEDSQPEKAGNPKISFWQKLLLLFKKL
ncbi:MAG: hypothetical protein NT026_02095 [Candidatus Staskawiczbacteria bacterium]|nr:hypothetical protein [Candidatus Staskawiczbacteria bacterium]